MCICIRTYCVYVHTCGCAYVHTRTCVYLPLKTIKPINFQKCTTEQTVYSEPLCTHQTWPLLNVNEANVIRPPIGWIIDHCKIHYAQCTCISELNVHVYQIYWIRQNYLQGLGYEWLHLDSNSAFGSNDNSWFFFHTERSL